MYKGNLMRNFFVNNYSKFSTPENVYPKNKKKLMKNSRKYGKRVFNQINFVNSS